MLHTSDASIEKSTSLHNRSHRSAAAFLPTRGNLERLRYSCAALNFPRSCGCPGAETRRSHENHSLVCSPSVPLPHSTQFACALPFYSSPHPRSPAAIVVPVDIRHRELCVGTVLVVSHHVTPPSTITSLIIITVYHRVNFAGVPRCHVHDRHRRPISRRYVFNKIEIKQKKRSSRRTNAFLLK